MVACNCSEYTNLQHRPASDTNPGVSVTVTCAKLLDGLLSSCSGACSRVAPRKSGWSARRRGHAPYVKRL